MAASALRGAVRGAAAAGRRGFQSHHFDPVAAAAAASETINIGIVGGGRNTIARHIPGLQALDRVAIVAIANRSYASASAVASTFEIPTVHRHWKEVVEDPRVDAVVIGTWPNLHAPVTKAALQAGKHVLCEARMATDVRAARAMVDALNHWPNLVGQIVPAPFSLPFDATIQRLVNSGAIGDLVHVEVVANSNELITGAQAGTPAEDTVPELHWRTDEAKSGLNTLTLGIWYETVARWVGHATAVRALTRVVVDRRINVELGKVVGVRVPDHVEVLADLAFGKASLRLQCSSVLHHSPPPSATLFGTKGTIRLEFDHAYESGKLLLGERSGPLEAVNIPDEDQGRWRVEEEFVNAIRGQESVKLTTFDEGLRYMMFTEAVHRAAATGKSVHLPLAFNYP